MDVVFDDVDLAVAVNVEILRGVLSNLSANGKKWWIACEPEYALNSGYLTIGFGDPGCTDRFNKILYGVPILNTDRPLGGPDKLVVLLDSSVLTAEQPGLYRDGNTVVQDEVVDIEEFFVPIRRALVRALAEYSGGQCQAD